MKFENTISISDYKIITIESNRNVLEKFSEMLKEKFSIPNITNIQSILFYYLKCGLAFDEILNYLCKNNSPGVAKTSNELFHSIFRQSDPLVKVLCIDDYSFNFPVPFYYPSIKLIDKNADKVDFEICQELWYTFPECLAIASFGLGMAGYSSIGKSELLDLVFNTNFVTNKADRSPFQLNSIEVKISKDLSEKCDDIKVPTFALFNCHRGVSPEIIRILAKHVNIILIHVHQKDFEDEPFKEELEFFIMLSKIVIVLIRDSDGPIYQEKRRGYYRLAISNCKLINRTKENEIKQCFVEIFQLPENSKRLSEFHKVNRSLIENVMKDFNGGVYHQDILKSKERVQKMIKVTKKDYNYESNVHFLSFYPIFIDYMTSTHKANRELNQDKAEKLNKECSKLDQDLKSAQTKIVIEHFFDLFEDPYSPLLLKILSEHLLTLNDEDSNIQCSIDVLWREALLSYKYDCSRKSHESKDFITKLQNCFYRQIMNGEPFELIDGDNLVFHSKDIDILLQEYYEKQKSIFDSYTNKGMELSEAPIVISILGAQNSGKSTLLNYLFGCRFATRSGRCTKGVYGSLFQMQKCINNSKTLLILDTEGLSAVERENSESGDIIDFDRTLALFCLSVSHIIIINIMGDISVAQKNLLEVCAYSLNRLKVNKIVLPKLFFVLNNQTSLNVENHASSLNSLMESLKLPVYSPYGEQEMKVSDIIRLTHQDLIILPSAFNCIAVDSPFCNDAQKKQLKLVTTEIFLTKCAGLKDKMINETMNAFCNDKPPFQNLSEWLQMAGLIWETAIKYQDIVMYPKMEEITFSQSLCDIYHKLIEKEIYQKQPKLRLALDKIFKEIDKYKRVFNQDQVLIEKMQKFDETFDEYKIKCEDEFEREAKGQPNFLKYPILFETASSNLKRLIFNFKKGFVDKLKNHIKFLLFELKISLSMKYFIDTINPELHQYVNRHSNEKKKAFDKYWDQCFEINFEDNFDSQETYFETLYSNFKMECNYIESFKTILDLFQKHKFDITKIISEIEGEILSGLKKFDPHHPEDWYFCTLSQSFVEFWQEQHDNTSIIGIYFSPSALFHSEDEEDNLHPNDQPRVKDKFQRWIPKELYPLVKSCSGKYNDHEIVWGDLPERIQILCLASELKDQSNSNISLWDTLMDQVKTCIESTLDKDEELTQSTIKILVKDFKMKIRILNQEIRYIRAMLSHRAERAFSTLLFSNAFKVYWKIQKEQIRQEKKYQDTNKILLEDYFLQKIDNCKIFQGDFDEEIAKANDVMISRKYALSFIEAVKRHVLSLIRIQVEEHFEKEKNDKTVEGLLAMAEDRINQILSNNLDEEVTTEHFVVQFICNRNICLEKLFHEKFSELEEMVNVEMQNEAKKKFNCFISPLERQLMSLQQYFKRLFEEETTTNILLSDYNFEINGIATSKEAPFRAMMLYLSEYLNSVIPSEDILKTDYTIEGVNIRRSDNCILPLERFGVKISSEVFQMLENTDIFYKEVIYDIYSFIENFSKILQDELENFSLETDYINQLFKHFRGQYLKDALGCDMRCPSCGKFCEKKIHDDGSKCQIFKGHQISSMGGKVWKNDASKSAVLFMCDDYQEFMNVRLPDRSMQWREFKLTCGSGWIWELQNDEFKNSHREKMVDIWSKFGRAILNYHSEKGNTISFVPYGPLELKAIATNFYICFLIDGTGSMREDIKRARDSVSKLAVQFQKRASKCRFRVVIYRDHCDTKIIEACPERSTFSENSTSIIKFLEGVKATGGGDGPEAMLDGFANAVRNTDWPDEKYSRNILVHIFDAPPHGDFPNYRGHSDASNKSNCCCCNRNDLCKYDWDEDVWNPMKDKMIFYHGINTQRAYKGFESTMKEKLSEFCGKFQLCGKEQVDEAVLRLFIAFHI